MNAQEKLQKGYRIEVLPDTQGPKVYTVLFHPRVPQTARGAGEPGKRVPRSPSVRVDLNHEPPQTSYNPGEWDDSEIMPADYEAKAIEQIQSIED